MEKETTKNKGRETYVSAKVAIIEMSTQSIICTSGNTEQYSSGDGSGWFNN